MDSGTEKLTNPSERRVFALLVTRCLHSVQFLAFLLFFIPFLIPVCLAVQQNFQWRNFTRIGDGLTSNNVRSLVADRHGHIWLATSAGLCRFDGFWHTLDGPRHNVFQVFEDAKGFIWALTDNGIYRGIVDLSLDRIDWGYHYTTENGLIDNRALVAIQRSFDKMDGNSGEIWIGTPLGVSRFDGEIWRAVVNAKDGQLHQGVQTIYEDQSGHLWFGLLPGEGTHILSHFDGSQWQVFGVDDGLPHGIVQTIAEDDAGTLWVGTTEGVAVKIGTGWEVFTTINSALIDNNVRVIMPDQEGVLWIGTTSGISLFDYGEWYQLTKANGLVSNDVRAIFESGDGEIWIGTADNGVSFCDRSWEPITIDDGLIDNHVITMRTDRNGEVLVGTQDGLNRYTTGGIETIEQLRGRETRAILEGASENAQFWVGSDKGFGMLQGNLWQDLRIEAETNEIQAIALDLDGHIWVSTGILLEGEPGFLASLNRYDGIQWHSEQEIFQQIDRTILVMFVDSRGRVYFGTLGHSKFETGLWVLDADRLNHLSLPPSGDVRAITEVSGGTIWIGTELGVHILDRETLQSVAHLSTDQGLVDNSVQVLYVDKYNRVWIGTSDGVSLFENGQFERTLTASDGLNSNNISAITEVGESLWFASEDDRGIAVFNPEKVPPRTRITSGPTRGEIIGDRSIDFKFEGGDASTPTAAMRYIYQLDDVTPSITDDDGFDKRVLLSNLDEGLHRFTVRAVDREGNIDPLGAVAEFTVDSTAPRVRILSPEPSAVIRQTFLVQGTASDENDFEGYQVQIFRGDGTSGEPILPSPFFSPNPVQLDTLFRWDTQGLSDGTYTIWLFARDTIDGRFDQQHTDETMVTVQVDNTPPDVRIGSPLPGSVISDKTEILLELNDSNLSEYTLAYSRLNDAKDENWVSIANAYSSGPRTVIVSWDTSALDGKIYVRAKAQDSAGNTSQSEIMSYLLENKIARPIVSILEPVGREKPLAQEVSVVATINVGVAESATIEGILLEFRGFSAPGEEWTEIRSFSARGRRFDAEEIARWDTAEVPDGEYHLRLTAFDNNGYTSEMTRDLILDNSHPVASLALPHDGAVLGIGVINVVGTATDRNFSQYELKVSHAGRIRTIHASNSQVENGRLALWNTPSVEGEYRLHLIVRDRAGLESSEELNVRLDAGEVVAKIRFPKTGEFVENSLRVIGTVHDVNFGRYQLQFTPEDLSSSAPRGQIPVSAPGQPKHNETLAVWVTPPLDEKYQIQLTAFDLSGKQSEHMVVVHIDNLEPEAKISVPTTTQLLSGTVEIIGTANDVHFQEYQLEYRAVNGPDKWISILNFPSTGAKQAEILASWETPQIEDFCDVQLNVTDRSGKSSIDSVRVAIDNQLPRVQIDWPVRNQLLSEAIVIRGIASDRNLAWYRLDFRDLKGVATWQEITTSNNPRDGVVNIEWTPPKVESGYEIRFMARDASGTVGAEDRIPVIVDRIPPQANILFPTANLQLPQRIEIHGTADDGYFKQYIIEYSAEKAPSVWLPISKPSKFLNPVLRDTLGLWNASGLSGHYTLRLQVEDSAGHRTVDKVRVFLSTEMEQDLGGVVQSQDGYTQIAFPPNSLPKRTVVTINPVFDAQSEEILSISETARNAHLGSVYDFAPKNLRLHHLKPATIEFFLESTRPVSSEVGRLIIVRRESNLWKPIGGTIDARRGTISTAVSVLGRYAVIVLSPLESDVAATINDLTCQPRLFAPNRREATAISFRLNRTNNITVKIYNEAGRLRRLLADSEQLSAGSHVYWWDGYGNEGRPVISNFYVVTVEGEGICETKTVIVKND